MIIVQGKVLGLAAALLAVGSFAGCTADQPVDRPIEDEMIVTPPDDSWQLAADGFGPLTVGMSAVDASAATEGTLVAAGATNDAPCVYAMWPEAPGGVRVMFEDDALVRVELHESGVATNAGVQVGDPVSTLDSLYGESARRMPHKYTDGSYVIVLPGAPADTISRIVFETDNSVITTIRGGRFPQVEYVEGCA